MEGREEGVLKTEEGEEVNMKYEIKCTVLELEQIKRVAEVHLAQAKCYAYFYAKQMEQANI